MSCFRISGILHSRRLLLDRSKVQEESAVTKKAKFILEYSNVASLTETVLALIMIDRYKMKDLRYTTLHSPF
jgi:hypothetical protein